MAWKKTKRMKKQRCIASSNHVHDVHGQECSNISQEHDVKDSVYKKGIKCLDLVAVASARKTESERDTVLLNNTKKENNNKYIRKISVYRRKMRKKPAKSSSSSGSTEDYKIRISRLGDKAIKSHENKKTGNIININDIGDEKNKTVFDYLVEEAKNESKKLRGEEQQQMWTRKEPEIRALTPKADQNNRTYVYRSEIDLIYSKYQITDNIFKVEYDENNKTYHCPKKNCGKSFPSLSRVKRHYIVHTGKKPYYCLNPDCKKSFSRKDNMLQHYRNHCAVSRRKRFREYEP